MWIGSALDDCPATHRIPGDRSFVPVHKRERSFTEQAASRMTSPPSTGRIDASSAPHSRAALSAIASSTGWTSVGELAMTPKISLVAVCCSNDSFKFLEQPNVLDRDHGLIGEGFEELDLRRGEGADLYSTRAQGSKDFPLLTEGND